MGFIAAHDPATGITNCTFVMGDMQGEEPITTEHVRNNQDVRDLLIRRVIVPENPPPEEDLKKLERKAKSSEKRLASTSGLSFGGEE
jgi:DNA-damage-inducible protein D